MIFSDQWLRELVDHKLDTQQLIDELTMAGLEVDGSSAVAREFTGIIVGLVEKVEAHPDADKLRICQVSDGKNSYQVVCGAPNVKEGMKVPFAMVGAEIQPAEQKSGGEEKPFKIKKAKLRGAESNGMLCSAEELGLEESSEGLLELAAEATVGEDVRIHLNLDDISIELDLTPNRGDCLGMRGLAREVGVISRQDVSYPKTQTAAQTISDEFPVKITAEAECPRYLGRIIKNINLNSESPLWMQEKLRRSGLRSIDPIVDVTNFVLMELGQPMHAFDFSKLEGHIDVRLAAKNEKLTLLDGKEVELTPDTLVIADAKKAVAMAGIMGGLDTSVTDASSDVFLECAFFSQLAVAGKARSYGMHTDASHRYERGVDYQLQHEAIERGTQLLLDIVGGEAGPIIEATGQLPGANLVRLNFGSIKRFLGVEIDNAEVKDILNRLGFEAESEDSEGIVLRVPSFRFDVAIEADLIEEIARIYGYNNIPQEGGLSKQQLKSRPEADLALSAIKQHLVTLGYQEVVTYSFIDPEIAKISCPGETLIELQNPISAEMSVMRPSILPGLLSCLKYNENRQQDRVRIFESGLVFQSTDGEIKQQRRLAGLISGSKNPINWNNNKEITDFYDVKGDVESLFDMSGEGLSYSFVGTQFGCFHSGQCARIEKGDGKGAELVGHIGALHPAIQRKLGITENTYVFELSLDQLSSRSIPVASKLSKFPEVSRDLAIVIDDHITSAEILDNVRSNSGEYLTDLRIFDVYQGDAVEKGKKSIALGLTWQHPSRTLSDDDINAIISSCVNGLQDNFNANLRN